MSSAMNITMLGLDYIRELEVSQYRRALLERDIDMMAAELLRRCDGNLAKVEALLRAEQERRASR